MLENIVNQANEHLTWVVQIIGIWLITFIVSSILQRILAKIDAKNSWRHYFVQSVSLPLKFFVWLGGFFITCKLINEQFSIPLLNTLLNFQPTIHTLVIGWFMVRFSLKTSRIISYKYPAISLSKSDVIQKIITAVVIITLVLTILPSMGISLSGFLAFGGIGGIIVGLAAKDMLSNLFSAIMLYFDRPFAIGDWIYLPEKDIEGIVEYIGWRQVTIRTFDKRIVYIPNAMFGNMVLVNPSKMTHRRIYETISIRYQDIKKLPQILNDIRDLLENFPDLDKELGIVVSLEKFNDYSVDILISAYTPITNWANFKKLKEAVLLDVSNIISKHNAE